MGVRALAVQGTEFDLRHIQPASMQWGRMDFQFLCQAAYFGGRKGVIQGGGRMGGQGIHDEDNFLRL